MVPSAQQFRSGAACHAVASAKAGFRLRRRGTPRRYDSHSGSQSPQWLAASLYRAAMTGLLNAAREVKESGTFGYLDRSLTGPEPVLDCTNKRYLVAYFCNQALGGLLRI
jgi:hypothetical protein